MGAGIAEIRGLKSEVGGPKTGKISLILFSCCFLFSCLAAGFMAERTLGVPGEARRPKFGLRKGQFA